MFCGRSSSGRARPCQGRGSEFEPRRPLQKITPSHQGGVFLVKSGRGSKGHERSEKNMPVACFGARVRVAARQGRQRASSPAPKNTIRQGGVFLHLPTGQRLEQGTSEARETCRGHVLVPACVWRPGWAASEPRRPLQKETPSFRMVFLFGMLRAGPNSLPRPARSALNQEVRQGSCEWLRHSWDAGSESSLVTFFAFAVCGDADNKSSGQS